MTDDELNRLILRAKTAQLSSYISPSTNRELYLQARTQFLADLLSEVTNELELTLKRRETKKCA